MCVLVFGRVGLFILFISNSGCQFQRYRLCGNPNDKKGLLSLSCFKEHKIELYYHVKKGLHVNLFRDIERHDCPQTIQSIQLSAMPGNPLQGIKFVCLYMVGVGVIGLVYLVIPTGAKIRVRTKPFQ